MYIFLSPAMVVVDGKPVRLQLCDTAGQVRVDWPVAAGSLHQMLVVVCLSCINMVNKQLLHRDLMQSFNL